MPSTFWGLNIATSGMNASQIALNTTSHNIANVNTTGYSKQSADITAAEALRVHREYGMFGSGVTVVDINRARESYYDVKYWNNNQNYGQQEVMHYYMEQIQLHFNEFGVSTTGFSEVYEDLFNALDELSNAPSEVNYRNVVIQHASSLTEYFENISINLQSIQEECNNEIKNITGRINSYAEGIASLNEQIRILQMNGGEPNDLFDKRDVLVDELSKIVNLNVADVLSDIGSSSYRIKINGQLLVDGDSYGELTVVPRTAVNKRNEEDMQGLYDVVWKTGVSFDEYHAETGGELQGYINIRDGNNDAAITTEAGAHLRGVDYKGIPHYLKQIDTWMSEFAYKFNSLHVQGQDLGGNAAQPFFILKDMKEMTIDEMNDLAANDGKTLVDYIKDNMTADNCMVNPAILSNPYKMATTYNLTEGVDSQDLVQDFVNIRDDRLYVAGTAQDCFQGIVSTIAIDTATAKSMETNFDNIGKAIINQRLSVSGVDEDEEAMDLVKYQTAYELAAKALTVMSEILDKLINDTAV